MSKIYRNTRLATLRRRYLISCGAAMFMLMLFMFCFFLGFIAMFIYLLKKLDNMARTQSDENAQLRVMLRAMESRLDKLSQIGRINALLQGKFPPDGGLPGESNPDETEDSAGHDPLLHLSFEQPAPLADPIDPGLDLNMNPPKPWELSPVQKDTE